MGFSAGVLRVPCAGWRTFLRFFGIPWPQVRSGDVLVAQCLSGGVSSGPTRGLGGIAADVAPPPCGCLARPAVLPCMGESASGGWSGPPQAAFRADGLAVCEAFVKASSRHAKPSVRNAACQGQSPLKASGPSQAAFRADGFAFREFGPRGASQAADASTSSRQGGRAAEAGVGVPERLCKCT